jgi:glucose-6-phosphate dehydrogenase assembly protein OpcA
MTQLLDTDSSAITAEFLRARRRAGSPAMGMVMTLVFVVSEDDAEEAMGAARTASREHPARVLGVILGDGRGSAQVDAEVGIGSGTGETAMLRLSGEVTKHPESVVLPLLLPDSPVVVWWPTKAPAKPGDDPLGRLAQRRITDAAAAPRGKSKALLTQARSYTPGNTDLAWTRITSWRALLAAALDQVPGGKVSAASVTAERISPSADLLAAWLADRLRVKVDRRNSSGPGITSVILEVRNGEIEIDRPDGRLATLSTPGQPDRPVALKRRETAELLGEELRRLDEDDVYADTVKQMAKAATGRVPKGMGKTRTKKQ